MGHVTRGEPMDLLLDRSEETFGYPHAVESTEGRVFDVAIFGVTPAAAVAARPLHLARLPIRVGAHPRRGGSSADGGQRHPALGYQAVQRFAGPFRNRARA
jgi:hypothetical protein